MKKLLKYLSSIKIPESSKNKVLVEMTTKSQEPTMTTTDTTGKPYKIIREKRSPFERD